MTGTILKSLRKEKGMSLRTLSEKSKISKTTINEIENGIVTNPTLDTLQKLADALLIPIGLLLNDESTINDVVDELYKASEFSGPIAEMETSEKYKAIKEIFEQDPEIFFQLDEGVQSTLVQKYRMAECSNNANGRIAMCSYCDDLPEEAKKELQSYIEFLHMKYNAGNTK